MIHTAEQCSRQRTLVIAAVFIVSSAGLMFEITLTRLFSLFFQYHFAFLAVSIAILGISLGAAWAQYYRPSNTTRTLVRLLVALALALLAAAAGIAWYPSAASILPRAVIAIVPFMVVGIFVAYVFDQFSPISGTLYGADLMGAALGVAGVLTLLNLWSAFSMVLFLGTVIGLLALIFVLTSPELKTNRRYLGAASGTAVLGAALLVLNLLTGLVDYDASRVRDMPRDKTMVSILGDPNQRAELVDTVWSPFARVDLVRSSVETNSMYIFTDGGAGSYMMRYDGTVERLNYLKDSMEYLPFSTGTPAEVLVMGAGGGKDIILALIAGAQDITAIEVNPAVIDITRRHGDYNGRILDLTQVNLIEGDARTFVERSSDLYDLMYLNLVYTQAADPTGQALIENYIFTVEAFRAYLEHLKPGGHLGIVSHSALEGSRAALTALQAMADMGIPPANALDHLMLWMYPADDATLRTSVLLVGKDPLTAETIRDITIGANIQGMQPLFVPEQAELLFEPLRRGMTLGAFLDEDADYDLSPTTDDSPYFFNLDYGVPRAIGAALLGAALLGAALLVVSLFLANPAGATHAPPVPQPWWVMTVYAALIGTGFLLVEIPLIQRFQLLLGYPILSLAAVLATLLLASGVGSLISQRWHETRLPRRVAAAGLCIVVIGVTYRFVLPSLVNSVLDQPLAVRLLVTVILTAVLGVPMGIPFPSLLRLAGRSDQRVALLWALNGAFSVLGSTLAIVVSMTWGFSLALLLGAALYLLLAGVVWRFMRV